jgi:methyl coenzyme M reductase beta subunit
MAIPTRVNTMQKMVAMENWRLYQAISTRHVNGTMASLEIWYNTIELNINDVFKEMMDKLATTVKVHRSRHGNIMLLSGGEQMPSFVPTLELMEVNKKCKAHRHVGKLKL